jgi:RNA-directed DNA polymerase
MARERQQGTWTQLNLFETEKGNVRHGANSDGGTETEACEEEQAATASNRKRALTDELMERVCETKNLRQAYQRVKANKGAPGNDGMTVDDMYDWIKEHRGELVGVLLEGNYQPQAVKGVEIPKPNGGTRQLGIPTVVDRLVQQAILQVLEPLLDPTFSESSYGFRRGRNAHQALQQAAEYVAGGRIIVVDFDISKFFD